MIRIIPKKQITCINKLTKKCKDCKIDYNPNNHPNNLDCKNHKEVIIRIFKVK